MTKISVSASMLDAISAQSELLRLVIEYAPSISLVDLGKEAKVIQNYRNTVRYRSVLLTFDATKEDKRIGEFRYGWFIYYDSPTILVFKEKIENRWERRNSLNLEEEFYYQLSDYDKKKEVQFFIRKSLQTIKNSL